MPDGGFLFFWLQFGGKNLTLCRPASLQGSCCTDLSHDSNGPEGEHGIVNGRLKDDLVTHKILLTYYFNASSTDCSKAKSIPAHFESFQKRPRVISDGFASSAEDLCGQQSQKSAGATM